MLFDSDDLAASGSDPASAGTENLFFGLHAPGRALDALERVRSQLRTQLRIDGFQIAPERMHLTLTPSGQPKRLRTSLQRALELAAGSVQMRAFDLVLERAVALRGSRAVVLLPDAASVAALEALRRRLIEALLHQGVHAPATQRFTPHLTLFYGSSATLEERAITPLGWRVDRYRLIRSLAGLSQHRIEGEWLLRP